MGFDVLVCGVFSALFLVSISAGQELLKVGFSQVLDERVNSTCKVDYGTVPSWIQGHFVRQVCGSFGAINSSNPLTRLQHVFDCLGMVSSYQINRGSVTFSNKYYDTRSYNIWKYYGKDLNRSRVAWGTTYTDFDVERVNQWSNNFTDKYEGDPSVSFWDLQTSIGAVTENAKIYSFDPNTLTGGPLKVAGEPLGLQKGSIVTDRPAHEQVGADGTIYSVVWAMNFATQTTGSVKLSVFKLKDNTYTALNQFDWGSFDLTKCAGGVEYPDAADRAQYLHSFAMTENFFIFPLTSYLLDYCFMFNSTKTGSQPFLRNGYKWRASQKSTLVVFRRTNNTFVRKIETDAFFATHQFNAYEKNGEIQLDMLTYPDSSIYTRYTMVDSLISGANFTTSCERFTINTTDWALTRSVLRAIDNGEFSSINQQRNGKEYNYGYMVSGLWSEKIPNKILKINMTTAPHSALVWSAPSGYFLQEPIFIPAPNSNTEDDGVLLVGGFSGNTKKGFMFVLNATTMVKISEVTAPLLTPIGIHNRFYARAFPEPVTSTPVPSGASSVLWAADLFCIFVFWVSK